jgi:hypothetical protein
MIALGIFNIIALFAVFEAWQDFERINNHEDIDHRAGWMVRAFVTCYLWGAASIWIGWDAAIYAVASAFLFSAVFRYALNRMRVLDWRYVAPWSNIYDKAIWSVTFFGYEPITWSLYRQGYLSGKPGYVSDIHRAGTIAYITELTTATACVMWAVLT